MRGRRPAPEAPPAVGQRCQQDPDQRPEDPEAAYEHQADGGRRSLQPKSARWTNPQRADGRDPEPEISSNGVLQNTAQPLEAAWRSGTDQKARGRQAARKSHAFSGPRHRGPVRAAPRPRPPPPRPPSQSTSPEERSALSVGRGLRERANSIPLWSYASMMPHPRRAGETASACAATPS